MPCHECYAGGSSSSASSGEPGSSSSSAGPGSSSSGGSEGSSSSGGSEGSEESESSAGSTSSSIPDFTDPRCYFCSDEGSSSSSSSVSSVPPGSSASSEGSSSSRIIVGDLCGVERRRCDDIPFEGALSNRQVCALFFEQGCQDNDYPVCYQCTDSPGSSSSSAGPGSSSSEGSEGSDSSLSASSQGSTSSVVSSAGSASSGSSQSSAASSVTGQCDPSVNYCYVNAGDVLCSINNWFCINDVTYYPACYTCLQTPASSSSAGPVSSTSSVGSSSAGQSSSIVVLVSSASSQPGGQCDPLLNNPCLDPDLSAALCPGPGITCVFDPDFFGCYDCQPAPSSSSAASSAASSGGSSLSSVGSSAASAGSSGASSVSSARSSAASSSGNSCLGGGLDCFLGGNEECARTGQLCVDDAADPRCYRCQSGSSSSSLSSRRSSFGFSSSSASSSGFSSSSASSILVVQLLCGNGIVDNGEECDRGSDCSSDPASCNRAPGTAGATCSCDPADTGCVRPLIVTWSRGCAWARCGDGVVNNILTFNGKLVNFDLVAEECDDSNRIDGDGCSAVCKRIPPSPPCGNGTLDPGEQCDDRNTASGDGCSSACQLETAVTLCGDGIVTAGETCDAGSRCTSDPASCNRAPGTAGATCACSPGVTGCVALPEVRWTVGCRWSRCGDGRVQNDVLLLDAPVNAELIQEECDDGNAAGGDGCTGACRLEFPERCGNGALDAGEQCDDGNNLNHDGCTAICLIERASSSSATSRSAAECTAAADCRSGLCQDGRCADCTVPAQCPSLQCYRGVCIPAGSSGSSSSRRKDILVLSDFPSQPFCADGRLQNGEECDDGNRAERDGCSSYCLLEAGICGDGIVQRLNDEQCEPGALDPSLPYGCARDCRFQSNYCGNDRLDPGEQCDDGPRNNDRIRNACRTDCSVARCGDGIIDEKEQCDDRNRRDADGCSRYCRAEQPAPEDILSQTIDLPLPGARSSARGDTATLTPIAISHPAAGQTGPAAVAIMVAGAAAGFAWIRRRRRQR
ncbi:MAG: hypothetical protein Greene041619_376 [Candidatus Peregrinibacteria bacterium Greene0416_19]|nr:MAG: hypothetical protein Greene041619_376 [Candidatus Peregrinibacteria bacterium Greene0416_19]